MSTRTETIDAAWARLEQAAEAHDHELRLTGHQMNRLRGAFESYCKALDAYQVALELPEEGS